MNVTFITGNMHKVEALEKWLGRSLDHIKIDIDELQELDPHVVIDHKVRAAYDKVKTPVLAEDVSLEFTAMGRFPGTFVKWFIDEVGLEGMCRMLDGFADRSATARIIYGYFDGVNTTFFEATKPGRVAENPKGDRGFGWDSIFIPEGIERTYAELAEDELSEHSVRNIAVQKLKQFLDEEN